MKTMKIVGTALLFTFFIGVINLNAQTDAWYDGGSLLNVDLCDHNALDEFGFDWLSWDVDNVLAAYEAVGMRGPVNAIEKQLAKIEKWLGEHGDGVINFDVTNQSKVDNILTALMEIGYEVYMEGVSLDNFAIMQAGAFLYYDAEHCLYVEYWGN